MKYPGQVRETGWEWLPAVAAIYQFDAFGCKATGCRKKSKTA
jgi:hypothetical protein